MNWKLIVLNVRLVQHTGKAKDTASRLTSAAGEALLSQAIMSIALSRPFVAPPHIRALLDHLHKLFSGKEAELDTFLKDGSAKQISKYSIANSPRSVHQITALDENRWHF